MELELWQAATYLGWILFSVAVLVQASGIYNWGRKKGREITGVDEKPQIGNSKVRNVVGTLMYLVGGFTGMATVHGFASGIVLAGIVYLMVTIILFRFAYLLKRGRVMECFAMYKKGGKN